MSKMGLLRLAILLFIAACLTTATNSVAIGGTGEHDGKGLHVHGLKSRRLLNKVFLISTIAFLPCSWRP